jgi:hypothetical protein
MIKFISSEIKVNGTVSDRNDYVNENTRNLIKTYLKTHLMLTPVSVIVEELIDSGFEDPVYIGPRTSDVDSILNRITSGLSKYGQSKFEYGTEPILIASWIEANVSMMTARKLINLIEIAILDCATTDYWYAFEKDII